MVVRMGYVSCPFGIERAVAFLLVAAPVVSVKEIAIMYPNVMALAFKADAVFCAAHHIHKSKIADFDIRAFSDVPTPAV